MGSDPTAAIEGLAKRHGIEFSCLSMGQGQEIHARRLLQQHCSEGGWVLLQNCHLGNNYFSLTLPKVAKKKHVNFL